MSNDDLEAARTVAFRFLGHSARSENEIVKRLQRDDFKHEIIETVLLELREKEYVNDDQFASDWVADRADRKRYGKTRLAMELGRKGIERETIKDVVGDISDEDELRRAMEIAESKSPIDSFIFEDREQRNVAKRKLGQFLQRRGFSWSVVMQVLELRSQNRD